MADKLNRLQVNRLHSSLAGTPFQANRVLAVVLRFGLLGGLTTGIVEGMFLNPLTFEPTWYSGVTYAVLAIVGALSLYAFRTALGSRPILNVQTD